MPTDDKEKLIMLIDHANTVIDSYRGLIDAMPKPMSWFEPWDDFCDLVEQIEEDL